MRRLSAWLGSVARRDREGGRALVAMLRMKTLKGKEEWGCEAEISSLAPLCLAPRISLYLAYRRRFYSITMKAKAR